MSLTPEDLGQVDWRPIDTGPSNDGTAYATHYGVLQVGDLEIRVYRLNTGQAVIHQDDFLKFLSGAA